MALDGLDDDAYFSFVLIAICIVAVGTVIGNLLTVLLQKALGWVWGELCALSMDACALFLMKCFRFTGHADRLPMADRTKCLELVMG